MIISDLMKMVVVLAFMFYMNWKLTWIVVGYAYFSSYHSVFQRKMVALRKFVRKLPIWIPLCKNE
jgi:ABC-type bacteriocin/lantibiotic exporter with double-glycine peptidase domain